MTDPLIAYLARDRAAQVLSGAPLAAEGMALIADLSGFTALAEMLAHALSPARGAEELTAALNRVFTPLIAAIHRHGGSVVKFGGDALIVWFPRPPRARRRSVARRALACAARLQAIMAAAGQVSTSAGGHTLSMKIGMAYGPALRVRLGDPTHGYEDVLGGATLDRMAEAEHQASPGEIILDPMGLGRAELPPARERRAGYLVVDTPAVAPWRGRHWFKLELLDEGRRTNDQQLETKDQGLTTNDHGVATKEEGPTTNDQGLETGEQGRAESDLRSIGDGEGGQVGPSSLVLGPSSLVLGPQPPLAPGPQRSDLLRPYLPPEVFQAVRAGRGQPAELKPVVSIFVQFQGISYESPAAEAQLGAYFSLAQRAAARYGGRVNRLITGDKGSLLHLIFGAPRALEELEQRAARCALEIRAIAAEMPYLSAQRIGMAFGRAFAGPVGSDERRDYTVIGDTINLSARLMQRSAPGQIVIDSELAARLAGFTLEDLGAAQLKGKAAPVPLFALISEGGASRASRPLSLLAGREAELGALRGRLAALQQGQGGVAILIGELGMGKTHLLGRLREGGAAAGAYGPHPLPPAPAAQERGDAPQRGAAAPPSPGGSRAGGGGPLRWAFASAPAYGAQPSGGLLGAALRELLGAAPEAALGELLGERRGAAAWPYVARLLGLPLEERQARELEAVAGESLRWRLFGLVPELIEAAAARAPLALALDDLQWADPTSLELVEALIPLAERAPLLLLLASRPERESRAWQIFDQLGGRAARVELGPLEVGEAAAIIAHHAPGLPAAAQARLAERGGGNPLFLVELARAAALAGPEAELPDSIQGLLLAQIDRLPPAEREALQVAAVLGPSVEAGLLGALLEDNDDEGRGAGKPVRSQRPHRFTQPPALTHQHLESLAAAGFLLREGAGYRFRHALIAESAYGALLYERRRGYHRAAAGLIERREVARIAELAGAIARHYELAGELGPAARYHGQAADGARLLYANAEAEAGYRHVLDLLGRGAADEGLRARTYLKLAQVRMNAGDYAAAQELYDQAFTLLEQAEQRQPQARRRRRPPIFRMAAVEPETLDPAMVEATASEAIVNNLFEGLVELDEDLNVVPAAARRWRIEDEGRRYVFELRPGLRWSDGTPLTAHDFVFAWRRNLDPATGSPSAHQLLIVQGAEKYQETLDAVSLHVIAEHDLLLVVNLNESNNTFLLLLTTSIAMPQPKHCILLRPKAWSKVDNLVCNGPFMIDHWNTGVGLAIRRNEQYWRKASVAVERASIQFASPDRDIALAEKLDLIRIVDRTPPTYEATVELTLQYMATYFLVFACNSASFQRPELRRAFALAIDQEALVQEVWAGVQQAATGGLLPPGAPGHSPGIGLGFQPDEARRLCSEQAPQLGSLTLASLPGFSATARFLAQSWHEVLGFQVNLLEDVGFLDISTQIRGGSVQMALVGWELEYPDPHNVYQSLFSEASEFNIANWHDRKVDVIMAEALSTSQYADRMRLYHEVDRFIVHDMAVVVPLYYERMQALLRRPFQLFDQHRMIRGGQLRLKQIQLAS